MKEDLITALIVEDQPEAATYLNSLISEYCEDIEVIGTTGSVVEAARHIQTLSPQMVFLDVELQDGTGFDLLEILDKTPFALIFTTASEDYAVKAFRFAAIDYLLKPIDPVMLKDAVSRARLHLDTKMSQLAILKDGLKSHDGLPMERLALHTHDRIDIVDLIHIVRCEADGNYTGFKLSDGKSILVTRTLKSFDKLLSPHGFLRVHQSHLVNARHIQSFHKHDGGYLQMKNGEKIPVSTRRRSFVVDALLNARF